MLENTARKSLVEHPQLIGYLFAVGMMLLQAGSVMAAAANTTPGP